LARIPLTIGWGSGFHFRPRGPAQRFAMPNLTPDGREEKGPTGTPSVFPGEFPPLEVPASLEPWVRARAAWRHPAFADLRIVDSWSCYYEMTPDDHPIVGAAPGVAGLYLAAGFSGHGFMHAPATAQLVVAELLDGRARTIDNRHLSRGGVQGRRLRARAGDGPAGRRGDARRPSAPRRPPRPLARASPERPPPVQGHRALKVRVTSLPGGARAATGHVVIVDVFRAF